MLLELIDRLRYALALLVLMALPPGLLLWIVIHPLARFWRRLGPWWTYGLLSGPAVLLASACFANYGGLYLATVLAIPFVLLVVVLEERELRQRFGQEYEEYSRRVPRFVPRMTTDRRRDRA